MSKDDDVNLTEDRLFNIGWGFIFKPVCAPASWDAERVAAEATRQDPPGTSQNKWVVSDPVEREGDFNGVNNIPCNDDCNRRHWLVNC